MLARREPRGAARALLRASCGRACSATRFLRLVGSPAVLSLAGRARAAAGAGGGQPGRRRRLPARVPRPRGRRSALLRENYFWSVYLNGRYTPRQLPRVPEARSSFARLQAGLVDNVRVVHRHRHATASPAATEPFTRLRAPRPHGLAGAATRSSSRRNGPQIFAAAAPGRAGHLQERRARRRLPPGEVRERLRFEPERARGSTGATAWAPMAPSTSPASSSPEAAAAASASTRSTASTVSHARDLRLDAAVLPLRPARGGPRASARGPASSCSTSAAARASAWRACRAGGARRGDRAVGADAAAGGARLERLGLAGVVDLDARPYGSHAAYAAAADACSSRTRSA